MGGKEEEKTGLKTDGEKRFLNVVFERKGGPKRNVE